jgi:hypothetical protein
MELAAVFDPTQATSGQFTASTLQTGSTMIVINKSYVDLILTFTSGDQRLVIANDRRAFQFVDASSVPGPLISWKQENIDYPQTINQLQNLVYVEIYAPTEKVVETYPSNVQRETLPSLIPYNIGYGIGIGTFNHSSDALVVWPSSYYGVTTAPQISQFGTDVGGMGFDYFWTESNMAAASHTMPSLPGNYQTTQKNLNSATLNSDTLAYNIPGPFSRSGLTPVDSATYLNGNYWTLASAIPWNTATSGYYVDLWVNLTEYLSTTSQFLYCDDLAHFANTGFSLYVGTSGVLNVEAAFTGGAVVKGTATIIPLNIWVYIAAQWTASTNTLNIIVNGTVIASYTTSGTPVNATHIGRIGSSPQDGTTFTGSICNIGILLSDITATKWSVNAPQARYLLGLQSLNVDMQNAWITEIELIHQTGATATTGVSSVLLEDVFNPAGLLYANVPVNVNALHIWRDVTPNNPQWSFSLQGTNQAVTIIDSFQKPLTHVFDEFPIISNTNLSTVVVVTVTVRGYNILGVG